MTFHRIFGRGRTLALLLLLLLAGDAFAAELSEYQVKAAFLANFAKFVEWPVHSFPDGVAPVNVGIVGDDPFGFDIEDSFKGKTLQGHPMTIKRVDWRDDLARFHIVFISASEKRHLPDILGRLAPSNVLTVSDVDGFCRAGGIIAFVSDNNRVRFEINIDAAQHSGLKISSKLLSLATKLYTKGN
jgi:hypothetical protein